MARFGSRFLAAVSTALIAFGGIALRAPAPALAVAPTELFLSEYIEGSSNNKALEIYNGTGAAVNLATSLYSITMHFNGATAAGLTINLTGTVASGDVYVVAQSSANAAILAQADQTDAGGWFNGDDAVVLRKNGVVIDVIGQVGLDPGTEWGTGVRSTADNTLQRRYGSCADTNASDAFVPSAQWQGFAIDTVSGLGAHVADCGVLALTINNVSRNESTGSQLYDFTVSLSAPAPAGGVTFDIATQDGTATTANNDYLGDSLTGQTIAAGQETYLFSVVVNGDTDFEPDETFFVNVTNVTGAFVLDGQGVGTLLNDDIGNPCAQPYTRIHAIQGSGASTPTPGTVTTAGVVTGDFETSAGIQGFYLQDQTGDANTATSDGILVFTGPANNNVNAGDFVRVTGFARERFTQTAIQGADDNSSSVLASNILVCSTGNPLPAPVAVTLPVTALSDFEPLEGMYVTFTQNLVISEYFNYDQFGEIVLALPLPGESRPFTGTAIDPPGAAANARTLANSLRRITLDDAVGGSNPGVLRHPNGLPFSLTNDFRGGDHVQNATGVLAFDFSLWRVYPTAPADFTVSNPRPASPADPEGRLTVAAQNTLNFFLTADYPTGDPLDNTCGPANTLECRGWDAVESMEFTRQRDKLLATLVGLDADIIGLNEIENSTGVDPLGDPVNGIVAGLNAILGEGTYAAISTGTIGTDAIKVGLIYRPAAVAPVGSYAILDSSVDPRFIDTKSRPVLAQTFEERSTGERFTVAVNHLKSKGSACTDVGDPDAGDGQGNCNGTRTLAAAALVDWLATDPTGSGDDDYLVIGDLNSYAREDPIAAVKAGPDDTAGTGDDYTNLVEQFLGTFAYSYTFDGQAGYLDHALSSASLTGQVGGVAEWHINSDEADVFDYDTSFKPAGQEALYEAAAYRSSDHDGVIVGLNLFGLPTDVAIDAGDDQSTTVETDFPTQLAVTVTDSQGNPVEGTEVTFTAPATGASASIVEIGPYLTDADGKVAVTAHANGTAGSYSILVAAGSGSASFDLTNVPGAPATVIIGPGDDQSTVIDTDFATTLSLAILDAHGNPVPSATVTFAAPSSGASAFIVETGPYGTDAFGTLTVTAHANLAAGGPYDLVATAGAASGTFHLTNLVGAPASVTLNAGDDQSTTVNTDFGIQLDVTVRDAGGNAVPGAAVTFAGPGSGASATIVEAVPYSTDGDGNLVVTAHANAVAGSYELVATSGAASATFNLTNEPGDAATMTINAGDNQSAVIDTDFATQLSLTVRDADGNAVPAEAVTFSGPASGAGASVVGSGPHVTNGSGTLEVTAHANLTAGGPYDFVATAGAATATFHLANLVGAPASITINAGDNQATTTGTDFETQLDLTVLDAGGNPVPGATVTFAGPASGASAAITTAGPYTTSADGRLVVTAHANATPGTYSFVAGSGAGSATFHLTNLPVDIAQLSSGATCSEFAASVAPTLTEITYGVNKFKITSLSEASFNYWVKVNAVAGSNTFTISQSITTGNFSTLFALASGSNVYRPDCSAGLKPTLGQTSTNATSSTITVTFTAPASGTYLINVKLSGNSAKGVTAPSPTTVHYVFRTTGVAGTTRALDLVKA